MVDVKTRLVLEAEGHKDAERALSDLTKEQNRLEREIKESAKSTDIASDAMQGLVKQYKQAIDAERELRDEVDRVNDKYGERRKVLEANDKFGRTSEGVSLFGDAESNLRTLGGAAGAFGATGIEQGISQVSEIPAIVEAIPRLKEAAVGLPAALGQAAASMGPVGAVATVAFGAVLLAVNNFATESQKRAEELNSAADAFRDRNQQIGEGITSSEIEEKLETLRRSREAEQETLDKLNQVYDDNINNAGLLGVAAKTLSYEEEALIEQIKNSEKAVGELDNQITGWNGSLDDASVALNDVIAKERELAQARLSDAQLAGDLARLEAEASDLSREQIEQRQRQLDLNRIELEAELEAIRSQDELTAAEIERIEQIEDALDTLAQKSGVLQSASESASSESELKAAREDTTEATKQETDATKEKADAEREAANAAREAQKKYEQAQRAQNQYAEAVASANTNFKNSISDIAQDLRDSRADNTLDTQRELQDLNAEYRQDEADSLREHQDELRDIKKNSERAERDALRTRDFSSLAQSREEEKEARQEAEDEFKNEGIERLTEAERQREEIVLEAERTTRDLAREASRQQRDARINLDRQIAAARQKLTNEASAYDQSLKLTQAWGQNFVQTIQSTLALAGGGGTSTNNINNQIDTRLNQLTSPTSFGVT